MPEANAPAVEKERDDAYRLCEVLREIADTRTRERDEARAATREHELYADTAALALKNAVIANDALRAALQWYAEADQYTMRLQPGEAPWSPVLRDRGARAKGALG